MTTVFVYDAAGQRVAEYNTQAPANSQPITSYLTEDALGTPRVITGGDAQIRGRHDYLPFGEEISTSVGGRMSVPGYGSTDNIRRQFTQKERDNETGLDYFGARYYAATQGRFTSVDPIKLGIDRLFDPQRMNLYAYVRNNPLAFTDPDGKDLILGSGDQKRIKKAMVEIAKRPGGRELLQKLDKLTIQIIVSTGETSRGDYGHNGSADPNKKPQYTPVRDANGNVVDIKGDPIAITLDFNRADKDRKENRARAENNKGMEAAGLPGKPLISDVPKSDSELEGHELVHGEFQFFKNGDTTDQDAVTGRIDAILAEPIDKNLAKDAEQFVDTLLQPNQPPPPSPEDKKKQPE